MPRDIFTDVEDQYDKIYRYCYFRLRDRQTAEDVTQGTFLRYLENYEAGTADQALRCLYTIARNLCVDEYRRCSREQSWKPQDEGIRRGIVRTSISSPALQCGRQWRRLRRMSRSFCCSAM